MLWLSLECLQCKSLGAWLDTTNKAIQSNDPRALLCNFSPSRDNGLSCSLSISADTVACGLRNPTVYANPANNDCLGKYLV